MENNPENSPKIRGKIKAPIRVEFEGRIDDPGFDNPTSGDREPLLPLPNPSSGAAELTLPEPEDITQ